MYIHTYIYMLWWQREASFCYFPTVRNTFAGIVYIHCCTRARTSIRPSVAPKAQAWTSCSSCFAEVKSRTDRTVSELFADRGLEPVGCWSMSVYMSANLWIFGYQLVNYRDWRHFPWISGRRIHLPLLVAHHHRLPRVRLFRTGLTW